MTQMPNPYGQFQPSNHMPQGPAPPPPEPRRTFRWWIVWVLAAIALVAFIVNNIKPAFSWLEVMGFAGVPSSGQLRYSQLAVFGLVIVGILLVIKMIRSGRSE